VGGGTLLVVVVLDGMGDMVVGEDSSPRCPLCDGDCWGVSIMERTHYLSDHHHHHHHHHVSLLVDCSLLYLLLLSSLGQPRCDLFFLAGGIDVPILSVEVKK